MQPKYATLQKIINGKRVYAITPRIKGGFVSPNNMIRFAEVAKKYKLSLKITSGQRIMLNGIKAEDVAQVWEDLDMEPAVLSPYSVKNTEICPGGICKRSRQNSLELGMRIEARYYGAPAPNRTKIGVVGCMNGCASVHAKDIGVKANEEGYIVVAGGSAGYHPRLPDEIAINLTDDEAYWMVEAVYTVYCDIAQKGEKLGPFIDRFGLDAFKEKVFETYENLKGEQSNE